jgi:hypothetical protein
MKWVIFIVTHGPIIEDYYKNDPLFSKEHYVFLNVSKDPIKNAYKDLCVINIPSVDNFVSLGKWWVETEAIYNIYRSGLYKNYNYVGFIHWDHELRTGEKRIEFNITEKINRYLEPGLKSDEFISLQTIDFFADFNQHIMMDENYPDKLTGNGRNCWEKIVMDYNEYFNNTILLDDLRGKGICISSSFLCGRGSFERMMGFYDYVIKKGYLDKFDLSHKYRFQGGMMERYAGMFFHDYKLINIHLYHHTKFNLVKEIKYLIYHYFWQFLPFPKKYV